MRRVIAFALCVMLCVPGGTAGQADTDMPRVGVLIYNATDTFMSNVFAYLQDAAVGVAEILYKDSQNLQTLQNDLVEQLLKDQVDALIINPVDRTAAVYLIRMIQPYGVPVVFVNREPLYEDMIEYDKAYYVGNDPTQSGILCGELLIDYFDGHPEADKNRDDVIQYIMIKGEPGHQDTELRTQQSVKTLKNAGYALEKLGEDTAMWERSLAKDKMAGFLSTFGDRIECVICNNDEMALGAIEALKAAGYYTDDRYMPVVGVDATNPAIAAIEENTLLGTVLNDAESLSDASLKLALLLAGGTEINAETFPYEVGPGGYVWTESRKITKETLAPK